jgi:hypothetical protein
MRTINRKWWLTPMALLLLVPAGFATVPRYRPPQRPRRTMPEGGSALVYVLGAGITCLGAMVVRSRTAKAQ